MEYINKLCEQRCIMEELNYRVGIVTQDGEVIAKNFSTKDECEDWVLEQGELIGIKRAVLLNKRTKQREYIY